MATHKEATELIAAAVEAIQAALTLGDEQGHKERWRGQSAGMHLTHAAVHTNESYDLLPMDENPSGVRREAQQALCRLAMALVKMEE